MNRLDLIDKLNHTKPFLMSQDFIPILTHFCFDEHHVFAYNDVAGILISMESELNCAVPGGLLLKILNTIQSETVRVEMPKQGIVKLISGKTNVKLPALSSEEFVFKIPDLEEIPIIKIPLPFLKGLSKCLISVGQDPSHPEQTGVAFSIRKDSISVYSTNNKSISKFSIKLEDVETNEELDVIIPAFFCEQLISLASIYAATEDTIDLYVQDSIKDKFVVASLGQNGSCKIFTRLINGEFINFEGIIERMIGEDAVDSFVPAPTDFLSTLERASLLLSTGDHSNSSITVEDDEITSLSESTLGRSLDVIKFPKPLGSFSFDVDPNLILNGFKVASTIAILPKLIVLTTDSKDFIHLISHSNTGA